MKTLAATLLLALSLPAMALYLPQKATVAEANWLPEVGRGVTRLTLNGERRGDDFPGEDFYRAVLKIRLGKQPVRADLKEGLPGKPVSR